MSVQQICRRHRINFQAERLPQIRLQRQLQRRHHRIGALVFVRTIHDDGTRSFRHQVEHPFRHLFVECGQDRQQVLLPPLLDEGLQRIDRRIRIPMVVTTGIDEMDQISRQRVRS